MRTGDIVAIIFRKIKSVTTSNRFLSSLSYLDVLAACSTGI